MRFARFCVAVLLGLVSPVVPGAPTSGQQLLRGCNAVIKQIEGRDISPDEMVSAPWCIGHVSGAVDAYRLGPEALHARPFFCLPPHGLENEKLVRVVVNYLVKHPQRLHETARVSVLSAFTGAFPCAK